MLTFVNGDTCADETGAAKQSTAIIAFPCTPGDIGGTFTVSHELGSCTFTLRFPTSASCVDRTAASSSTSSGGLPSPAMGDGAHTKLSDQTDAANGGKAGQGHWGFFSLVLFGFMVYCIAGCAWRFKKEGATGVDMIPHLPFWSSLPTRISDAGAILFAIGTHV